MIPIREHHHDDQYRDKVVHIFHIRHKTVTYCKGKVILNTSRRLVAVDHYNYVNCHFSHYNYLWSCRRSNQLPEQHRMVAIELWQPACKGIEPWSGRYKQLDKGSKVGLSSSCCCCCCCCFAPVPVEDSDVLHVTCDVERTQQRSKSRQFLWCCFAVDFEVGLKTCVPCWKFLQSRLKIRQ